LWIAADKQNLCHLKQIQDSDESCNFQSRIHLFSNIKKQWIRNPCPENLCWLNNTKTIMEDDIGRAHISYCKRFKWLGIIGTQKNYAYYFSP
jgi:hypothetical protein